MGHSEVSVPAHPQASADAAQEQRRVFVFPFAAQGPETSPTFWDELQKGSAAMTISKKLSENSKEFVQKDGLLGKNTHECRIWTLGLIFFFADMQFFLQQLKFWEQ